MEPRCRTELYPIVYIDDIGFNIQANNVILGISGKDKKGILSATICENESAKFWLNVLNELKNRGV